ncbi:MAG: thioesterase [Oscillospiraceae bacterium]|nr:thioesterase [Oscillospiraceae bacterium]
MNEIFTKSFHIGTPSVDRYNQMRPSALLSCFQEMATEHAEVLKIHRDYLVENYNACWILARTWFRLSRPIRAGEDLTITTWHRGAGGLVIYRDYDLFVGEECVGEAVGAWVVADVDSRKMLRPASIENLADSPRPEQVKKKLLRLIRTPAQKQKVFTKTVRYSDLDVNGHMNNTKYADVILDALSEKDMEGRFIASLQLNYSMECRMGESMDICRALENDHCYIDGCSEDGVRRFEANVEIVGIPGIHLDEAAENE